MPGWRSLLLLLLALSVELPPAPAQQHRTRHRGAAPSLTAAPRRAPRLWRPPAALPAPGKGGECPAGGSGAPRGPGLCCLSDRGCPGAQRRCRRRPLRTCLLPSAAKPGLCPRKRVQRSAVACSSRCAHDRDCSGNRKCCFSRCRLACASPDRVSRLAAVKPGMCPVVLRGSLGPCLELCDTDSDCPGAAKCCTTGCGHICKPPTEVRPGLCPPMADGDRAAECLLLCLQDRDCPHEQKCCLQGCGRTCIPPLQGTA